MQTGYVSTTKLLKMAHDISNGNIEQAIEHLGHLGREYVEAPSAIRVLKMKLKKHPGSTTFSFHRSGFVEVA